MSVIIEEGFLVGRELIEAARDKGWRQYSTTDKKLLLLRIINHAFYYITNECPISENICRDSIGALPGQYFI